MLSPFCFVIAFKIFIFIFLFLYFPHFPLSLFMVSPFCFVIASNSINNIVFLLKFTLLYLPVCFPFSRFSFCYYIFSLSTLFTFTFHGIFILFRHCFKLNHVELLYFSQNYFVVFASLLSFCQGFHVVAIFTFHTFHFHFSWYLHFVSSSLQTQCTFTGKQFTSWCCNPIRWKILSRLRSNSNFFCNFVFLLLIIFVQTNKLTSDSQVGAVMQSFGKFFQV